MQVGGGGRGSIFVPQDSLVTQAFKTHAHVTLKNKKKNVIWSSNLGYSGTPRNLPLVHSCKQSEQEIEMCIRMLRFC